MRALSVLLTGGTLLIQGGPRLEVGLERNVSPGPALTVSLRGLLTDDRFLRTMQSGFPLYVAYTAELRRSRSNWFDQTVDYYTWEFVVLHDPVRESFVAEQADGTVHLGTVGEFDDYLSRVFDIRQLTPNGEGRYYYKVTVDARTLSDADVDEVFDWLKGDNADSSELRQRGLLTRTARHILVRVAPLPRLTLTEETERFRVP